MTVPALLSVAALSMHFFLVKSHLNDPAPPEIGPEAVSSASELADVTLVIPARNEAA